MHAALPIKLVILVLLGASLVSWAMIFRRWRDYRDAEISFYQFEQAFWSGIDLSRLYREGDDRAHHGEVSGLESIFRAGFKEFTRLRKQPGVDADAVMEGTQRAMRVALAHEEEYLEKHLPFLAILELKREGFTGNTPVTNALKSFNLHPTGFSKYCIGSVLVRNMDKKNILKSKLLLINKLHNESTQHSFA